MKCRRDSSADMLLQVITAILIGSAVYANHLIGEHVCPQNETFTVTVQRHYKKNSTIREFVWCMSVPPRCSKYRTVLKDVYKIEEEQRVRLASKCCSGYKEDANRTFCIPACSSCIHGTCSGPDTCTCVAGFTGASCNQSVPCASQGRGETEGLMCPESSSAPCSADTGYCPCEPGYTGSKCENLLPQTTSSNCTSQDCKSSPDQTNQLTNNTEDFDSIIEKNLTRLPELNQPEMDVPAAIRQETATSHTTHPHKEIKNNAKEAEMKEITSDLTDIAPSVVTAEKPKKNFDTGKTHFYSDDHLQQWQMDEIRIENTNLDNDKHRFLISSISIAVGVSVVLILIAVISVLVARYKKRVIFVRKNETKSCAAVDNNNRLSSQPIIQRSTFHAPLPDPPVFQSPTFTLNDDGNRCTVYSNRVYYNNLEGAASECQYDYPPSTGSYRAASLPDPGPEPLYDEIPAWRRPQPVSGAVPKQCRSPCGGGATTTWQPASASFSST